MMKCSHNYCNTHKNFSLFVVRNNNQLLCRKVMDDLIPYLFYFNSLCNNCDYSAKSA